MLLRSCLFLVSLFLVSCEPFVNSRGNVVIGKEVDSFIIGRTTMEDVLRSCGSPSLHKDNFTWIYIGGRSEEVSFKGIQMKERSVIKLIFDRNKVLKDKIVIHPSDKESSFDEEVTNLITKEEVDAFLKKKYE